MRILQVFNRYRERGGEEEWVERIPQLVDERFTVETLWFDSRDWLGSGAPWRLRQAWLIGDNPASRKRLAEAAARFRPDVLLFHNLIPVASLGLYAEAKRLGLPVVQYLHNYRPFSASGYLWVNGRVSDAALRGNPWPEIRAGAWDGSQLKTAVLAWHLARLRRSGDLDAVRVWLAVSDFVRGKLIEAGLPADRVVALRHCWPAAEPRNPAPEGDFHLFLGRLCAAKGVHVLLDAWQILEQRLGSNCPRLVVAGSGPLEERVRAAARTSSRITFPGYVTGTAKDQLLNDCRSLIVPSLWWEPLGLIVYEAYERARPVISSGAGGLAETIDHGVSGLLYSPADPASLAGAVERFERIAPAARATMGRNGRAWLCTQADPRQWAGQLANLVAEILPSCSNISNAAEPNGS